MQWNEITNMHYIHLLEATITSGDRAGHVVFIPCIIVQSGDDFGFQWQRHQFPIYHDYEQSTRPNTTVCWSLVT